MKRISYNIKTNEEEQKETDGVSLPSFIILCFIVFGLSAAFIGVTISYNNRLNEPTEQFERLQMQLDDANSTNGDQSEEIERLEALLQEANTTNGNQQSLIDALIVTNSSQYQELEYVRYELEILQSQIALLLNQLMNGTSGGGGGMMTTAPAPPGSSFVNFNSTPFIINVFGPNCCIGVSSQRTDIYTFDYLNQGQAIGSYNATQTILQNYGGVAFRMIDIACWSIQRRFLY
jgi:hypothetical protein